MSKGKSAIFWELRKSIGQHKFSTRPDGEIIGSMKGKKDPTYKDPAKREKRDLRIAGYGGSGKVTRVLKVILREGFLERKRNQSPANAFVQKNVKTLCTATRDKDTKEIVLEYDFDNMSVSSGSLDTPNVDVAVNLEEGIITFTQTAEVIPGGLARDDDKLFACLFSVNNADGPVPAIEYLMRGMLETLRQRGENGVTSTVIPAGWNKVNLFIYTFAASADGTYSSPTVRSYPPPTAREIALAKVEQEWEDTLLRLAILRNTATDEQLEAIDRAKKEEKTIASRAEKDALRTGLAPFEAKLTGLRAGIDRLKGI